MGWAAFSFHTGHGGRKHGDWIGLMVEVDVTDGVVAGAGCRFVRHNDRNETVLGALADEAEAVAELTAGSAAFGGKLTARDDALWVALTG